MTHTFFYRFTWLFLSALLTVCFADAQYISLQKSEIKKLARIIKNDAGAKKLYLAIENAANTALQQQPNPIDTIISEGHLATDPKKMRTQQSLVDMNKSYALAFAYRITGKKEYLLKCRDYILAWAQKNKGAGNPINDTKLDAMFEAYDLIRKEITADEKQQIDTWMMQVADAEIAHPRFRSANKSAHNNWNSHRIKVVGNIAYVLDNKNYKTFTDTALQTQLAKNLYADGSGMDFEERDALHYHVYTLEPLLKIITIIKRADGKNYYDYVSPTGSSIRKSVDFLVPYVTGEKVHHEFVNSKTLFDKQRAENKEPGYTIGADFKPNTAIDALSYAAYFDNRLTEFVRKLMSAEEKYPNWSIMLNAVRK